MRRIEGIRNYAVRVKYRMPSGREHETTVFRMARDRDALLEKPHLLLQRALWKDGRACGEDMRILWVREL